MVPAGEYPGEGHAHLQHVHVAIEDDVKRETATERVGAYQLLVGSWYDAALTRERGVTLRGGVIGYLADVKQGVIRLNPFLAHEGHLDFDPVKLTSDRLYDTLHDTLEARTGGIIMEIKVGAGSGAAERGGVHLRIND